MRSHVLWSFQVLMMPNGSREEDELLSEVQLVTCNTVDTFLMQIKP